MFEAGSWPDWAYADMWAPEMQFVNGKFLVYFSARKREDDRLAIGVAISQNPDNFTGPFLDSGKPLVDDHPGVIDVHWYRDPV